MSEQKQPDQNNGGVMSSGTVGRMFSVCDTLRVTISPYYKKQISLNKLFNPVKFSNRHKFS